MKNNKGFTLVEILAVISILAILGLVVVPAVDAIIKSSKNDLYEEQLKLIISAAQEYSTEHVLSMPTERGQYVDVTIRDLKKENFIDLELTNPKDSKCFGNNVKVRIVQMGTRLEYELQEDTLYFYEADICGLEDRG